jgi:hypothetical protein
MTSVLGGILPSAILLASKIPYELTAGTRYAIGGRSEELEQGGAERVRSTR